MARGIGRTVAGVAIVAGSLGFAVGAVATSGATNSTPTSFFACLKGGNLSSVSNTPHNCSKGYVPEAWGGSVLPAGDRFVSGQLMAPSSYHEGAQLRGADLSNLDLSYSDFKGAVFGTANFTNANLTNANFTWADLSEANLTGATTSGMNVTGADFAPATICPNGIHYGSSGANCPTS
jgi:uncharacterized protein YjbI with pentapeptide repeats